MTYLVFFESSANATEINGTLSENFKATLRQTPAGTFMGPYQVDLSNLTQSGIIYFD